MKISSLFNSLIRNPFNHIEPVRLLQALMCLLLTLITTTAIAASI